MHALDAQHIDFFLLQQFLFSTGTRSQWFLISLLDTALQQVWLLPFSNRLQDTLWFFRDIHTV